MPTSASSRLLPTTSSSTPAEIVAASTSGPRQRAAGLGDRLAERDDQEQPAALDHVLRREGHIDGAEPAPGRRCADQAPVRFMTAAASHHHSLVFGSASAPITHSAVDGMTQISMLTACRAHQRRRAEEIEEDDADVADQERDREQPGRVLEAPRDAGLEEQSRFCMVGVLSPRSAGAVCCGSLGLFSWS